MNLNASASCKLSSVSRCLAPKEVHWFTFWRRLGAPKNKEKVKQFSDVVVKLFCWIEELLCVVNVAQCAWPNAVLCLSDFNTKIHSMPSNSKTSLIFWTCAGLSSFSHHLPRRSFIVPGVGVVYRVAQSRVLGRQPVRRRRAVVFSRLDREPLRVHDISAVVFFW